MKNHNTRKGKLAIRDVARRAGKTPEEVKADIEEAIAAAWESDDPAVGEMQKKLFPNGRPTPEEFIVTMSSSVQKKRRYRLF